MNYLAKIISGGQTGVDRATLDAAIAAGVPYDGWVPRGRRAEDGRVSERYVLREHTSDQYPPRTIENVTMADLVIVVGDGVGSLLTVRTAKKLGRECAHLRESSLEQPPREPRAILATILHAEVRGVAGMLGRPVALMVAGSRESRAPGIYARTLPVLTEAFRRLRGEP